jgi:hypothetical protein
VSFTGSTLSGDASVTGWGTSGLLAIGGTAVEGLVVAGALRASQTRDAFHGSHYQGDRASMSGGALGVLVDWFPNPTQGFHVGGLAGLGVVTLTDSSTVDSNGAAFAGSVFGGYDWWIGPQWSLGLMIAAMGTTSAELRDQDQRSTGYSFNALSVGLEYALTHH